MGKALNLYDYQRNGQDPDLAVSKYHTREEVAVDVELLAAEIARRARGLVERVKREELEKTLKELEAELG